jgi:hypothetical protein
MVLFLARKSSLEIEQSRKYLYHLSNYQLLELNLFHEMSDFVSPENGAL